ncbi:MAG: anti-sigma factor antagonist [candidate division FCPU426 bacterium]
MSSLLEFNQQPSPFIDDVLVLSVRGSIDSETAPRFEKELSALLTGGHSRVLVDMAETEYVSSAGVGVFIGMIQEFRSRPDGDIKACRVSKKILKIFESIGLDDMLDIYPDAQSLTIWTAAPQIEETLSRFALAVPAAEVYCGEEFVLRVEARDSKGALAMDYQAAPALQVSAGMIFPVELLGFYQGSWQGKVRVTASGELTLTVKDGHHVGNLTLAVKERERKAVFPIVHQCPTCRAQIQVQGPDLYRCEMCDETFRVDDWGHVFTLKPGSLARRRKSRYKGIDIRMNADVNYLGVIRQTVSSICQKEGMDDVTTNAVTLAVEEILLNIIEHGNDYDPWQILRLRLEFQKKQAKIQIRDYGDPFDVTKRKDLSLKSKIAQGAKRGVGGLLVNQLMDQVKYESLPTYNQLTLIKRYGEAEPGTAT